MFNTKTEVQNISSATEFFADVKDSPNKRKIETMAKEALTAIGLTKEKVAVLLLPKNVGELMNRLIEIIRDSEIPQGMAIETWREIQRKAETVYAALVNGDI